MRPLWAQGLRLLIWSLLLLLIASVLLVQQGQRWLAQQGIEDLGLSGVRWQTDGLLIERLSLTRSTAEGYQQLAVDRLLLQPDWQARRLRQISVDTLWLSNQPDNSSSEPLSANPLDWPLHTLTEARPLLAWLPQQLQIERLQLELPCGQQHCQLQGQLDLSASPEQLQLTLQLQGADEQLTWHSQLDLRSSAHLLSQLQLNQQPLISLELSSSDQHRQWHSSLQIPHWPESDGLLDALSPWLNRDGWPIAQLPRGAQLNVTSFWQGQQPPASARDLLRGDLALQADLELPQPWRLPGYARISGTLHLGLAHFNQRWQLSQLDSRLTLDQLSHPAVNDLPAQLRPDQLELTLTAAEDQLLGWQQGLQASLSVQAKKRDQLALHWSSQLDLTPQADWQLSFSQGQLTASLTQLDRPEAQLTDLRLAANALSGQLNAKRLQLDKDAALSLQVQRLQAAALETQTGPLSLTLRDTLLHWPWNTEQRPSLSSRASLQVSQLRHPLLKTRTWQANGQLDWQQGRLQAEVKLHNSAGLTLTSQLQQSGSGAWQAEVHLEEMFFRAANPLADSLADWPELLSLSSGQLSANASLSGKPQPLQLDGQISLTGGQGIYDRSSFSGLDLPLQIRLRNQQLTLTTQALQLQQLDPGLPMGPLQIAADYRARLDVPTQGQLDLQQAELQLLGGRLWLQPGTIALDSAAQQLSLQLSGIELGRLLEVYPTEGLFGGGTLDGQLPLRLTEGAISVDKGLIQAREPGGVLQYRSERIDALAASNPGMRELARALDDFRYTLLRSTLDYRDDGTLLLGLRLEGSNPALQQGRPVHLNIALEEDIPALLASLQLSGQVNEIIQQRVQQHLLQRQNP